MNVLKSFNSTVTQLSSLAGSLDQADIALAFVFVAEVLMRMAPDPRSFLSSPWDVCDAFIVVAYAIGTVLLMEEDANLNYYTNDGTDAIGTIMLLRVLRLLRFHRFIYAMSATSGLMTGAPSRRERLVKFCKHAICCRKHDDDDHDMHYAAPPPPRGFEGGEDPIEAMKAARAKKREEASGAGGTANSSELSQPPPQAKPTATKLVSQASECSV